MEMMIHNKLKRFLLDELPSILTITGISGFITAGVMAVKVTPIANEIIDELEPSIPESGYERKLETVKALLPIYGPAIGITIMSAALVIGGQYVSRQRLFAVNSLYMASQQYLVKLQDNIVKEVGQRKFTKIKDSSLEPDREPDISVPEGVVLFYDVFSDRYFTMDSVESIRTGINDLNAEMYSDMFVTVNDFYAIVGLPPVTYSNDIGWQIEDGPIDIYIGSALTKDNKPCVTVKFEVVPKHIYHKIVR